MTHIFRSLEIRHFPENDYIAHELDECTEILLVDEGKYKMGFRVNNKEHLKLIFGRSTQIGAYNLMFMMRHEFTIKSLTKLDCFAIRMRNVREIFSENPQFT